MSVGCRIRRNFERPDKELVEAFRGIPVANIDDILSVHGIDSVFIGPVDLAMSMGIPGDNNNPKLVETIRYIARKAHEYHLSAGMFCESPEMLRKWVNEVDYVTTGYDVSILLNAATKALQDFKAAIC